MKRSASKRVLPVLLASVSVWVATSCAQAADAAELSVGDLFPDLSTFGLEGKLPPTLKGRVTVIDFWASWCGPCRLTFPLMEELHHRFANQGLIILAVNEDKSRPAMVEFLKDHPVSFMVVRDAKKKLAATVNVPFMPCSYVLDGDGRVLSIQSGASIAQNRKAFVKSIEELVAKESHKP